jgi:hypothetical protein
VQIEGDADVQMNGLYYLGTIRVASLPDAAAKGITIIEENTYGTRHSQCIVSQRTSSSSPANFKVSFPYVVQYNPSGEAYDRDYDANCIHILDNNGHYGLMANREATDGTRGATFESLILGVTAGSQLTTGGYSSYQRSSGYTNANHHHGWAGVFGDDSNDGQGPSGISLTTDPVTLFRQPSYEGALWQQARTGTKIDYNQSLTYDAGTAQLAYDDSANNALNIRSAVWYKGIDIDTAQTVGGSLETITISSTDRQVFYG